MAVFPAVLCLFMAAIVTGQNVDISPKKAVRKLGDSVIVMCKVPYKIDSCRFNVGGQSYRLSPTALNGDVIYSGQGLEVGECGAELKNVREEWNGKISCILPPQSGAGIEITGDMQLIVARQPGEPTLITPPQSAFREDDKFFAQCKVPHGRPAARISWFLDSEPLLSSLSQPAVTSEPGSDLETISQNATLVLRADDDGKMLECKTEHEALEQPLSSKRQLVVHYKPKRLETGTLTIFGLKLGSEGRLNVTVRSNPAPQAVWQVGDMQVTPGQPGNQGLVALKPVLLNNGFYNVTLVLEQIAKEDVDRTYYLTVGNALGSEQIPVRISTLDEPAGMELGAGSIAGIVIAVLILLIAIFLAVFAFATDRWCFAGRSHRTDIPDGADSEAPLPPHDDVKGAENPTHDHGDYISNGDTKHPEKKPDTAVDTESAVGGRERSRLANLGARVMAALPRSKDKVQASEAQPTEAEEKALSEEKKGVVYAELVLGDTSSEKPPPPSTEYAEIVYTEQPKEEHKETPQ